MRTLPAAWETERLEVRNSAPEESEELWALFNACSYAGVWDETFRPEKKDVIAELISKSQTGEDHFRMQTVRLKETAALVGYFHVRHGFPQPHVVWISMLVVHPQHQRQGFGPEIMEALAQQVAHLQTYQSLWLRVYLKNLPALRSWIRAGFRTILEYRGDKVFSEDGHASIILERRIA